jgi:predicted aspartyl protease
MTLKLVFREDYLQRKGVTISRKYANQESADDNITDDMMVNDMIAAGTAPGYLFNLKRPANKDRYDGGFDDWIDPSEGDRMRIRASFNDKERKLHGKLVDKMNRNANTDNSYYFVHDTSPNFIMQRPSIGPNGEPWSRAGMYQFVEGMSPFEEKQLGFHSYDAVMVDAGMKSYRMLDYKTYQKLRHIRFMTLRIVVSQKQDGDDYFVEVINKTYKITSMNQLFYILNRREGIIEMAMAYQTGDGWYSEQKIRESVSILFDDDSVKKMSLDKFLQRYQIYG